MEIIYIYIYIHTLTSDSQGKFSEKRLFIQGLRLRHITTSDMLSYLPPSVNSSNPQLSTLVHKQSPPTFACSNAAVGESTFSSARRASSSRPACMARWARKLWPSFSAAFSSSSHTSPSWSSNKRSLGAHTFLCLSGGVTRGATRRHTLLCSSMIKERLIMGREFHKIKSKLVPKA